MSSLCDCFNGYFHPLITSPSTGFRSLPKCPDVSQAHWAMSNSPLSWQSESTWATSILSAWSTCSMFWWSSVVLPLGLWASVWCVPLQQCLARRQQSRWVYASAANWSVLPPSMCQYLHETTGCFYCSSFSRTSFCKLVQLAFSFDGFDKLLCRTLHRNIQLLMTLYNTIGSTGKQTILLFTFW